MHERAAQLGCALATVVLGSVGSQEACCCPPSCSPPSKRSTAARRPRRSPAVWWGHHEPLRRIREALASRVVVADGAMGTMLQAQDPTLEDFQGLEGCNEILNASPVPTSCALCTRSTSPSASTVWRRIPSARTTRRRASTRSATGSSSCPRRVPDRPRGRRRVRRQGRAAALGAGFDGSGYPLPSLGASDTTCCVMATSRTPRACARRWRGRVDRGDHEDLLQTKAESDSSARRAMDALGERCR